MENLYFFYPQWTHVIDIFFSNTIILWVILGFIIYGWFIHHEALSEKQRRKCVYCKRNIQRKLLFSKK